MPDVSMVLVASPGAMVVVMGLVAGPLGLVAAFFATYAVHSAIGAVYETLLHGEVDAGHRATVLSLASMVLQPAGSLGAVVLGLLATGVSTGAALVVAGIVLALAAPLFLVGGRPPAGTAQAAELVGGRLDTAGASGGSAPVLRERPFWASGSG
jgi:DHA1 family tetracycline resistance protein-like MFS transporter